jgi:hypothetical protein
MHIKQAKNLVLTALFIAFSFLNPILFWLEGTTHHYLSAEMFTAVNLLICLLWILLFRLYYLHMNKNKRCFLLLIFLPIEFYWLLFLAMMYATWT